MNMERPTGSSHLAFTLAGITAVGGLAGYLKTRSTPSLIAGLGIGGVYLYGGWLINNGRPELGHQASLAAAVVLAGSMVPRYLKTRKVWPAGIMAVTGVVSALYEGRQVLEWM